MRLLRFKETPWVALGYSKTSASGSGIGFGLAASLADTAHQVVQKGVVDPILFELVGILEEGIGADRVSDMTIRVILPDLLAYSQRVADALSVNRRVISYSSREYSLAADPSTKKPIVLIPMEILRDLPVAKEWNDIDRVCMYNEALRAVVNRIIGDTWRDATTRIKKQVLRDTLIEYPEALRDLFEQYRVKQSGAYNFAEDPLGAVRWHEAGITWAKQFPLKLSAPETANDVREIVRTICHHFKRLIEQNGLSKLLYDAAGTPIHESYAQLLFFGVADAYCEANNVDLSREPNAGRGPVDFKLSQGGDAKVVVEVKYTSNQKLVDGFTKQLPTYGSAERASSCFYLVIRRNGTTDDVRLATLWDEQRKCYANGLTCPEIVVIDGRWKPSASKL